ncbi:MAG: hypothetical protein IJX89_02240 [Alphaproteobacteria bacterium]|nr:hypothetical protein [Alphaproteobacteria bacterium]
MNDFYRCSDAARQASDAAFKRELKNNDEYLHGRMVHRTSIAGIQAKHAEIQNKIKVLQSKTKPDMAQINRLTEILALLESTLSRCH